ncbi:MAG: hypothetical protein U0835_12265 [Isosphaeraceae bacterium]
MLQLLKERGAVRTAGAGRRITLVAELSVDEAERMAQSFREKDEQDRLRHREGMAEYVESCVCRWVYLLDYFGNRDPGVPDLPRQDRRAGHLAGRKPLSAPERRPATPTVPRVPVGREGVGPLSWADGGMALPATARGVGTHERTHPDRVDRRDVNLRAGAP